MFRCLTISQIRIFMGNPMPLNVYQKGLEKREDPESDSFGIYDGSEFVFDGSRNEWILALQLLYHYGFDLLKLKSLVKSNLNDFAK